MKTPSPDLFNLIKSLNTQEKVQFKMYSSRRKSENDYIKLFDVIDKQEVYDEALVKKRLEKEPLIKNLDRVKIYVIEAILKCLQEYYSSDSADAIIANNIQQIQILMNKRLFGPAKKMIAKTEKLALETHEYYYLPVILSLKREIMILQSNLDEINKYPRSHYLNEVKYLDILKNFSDYGMLNMQVLSTMYAQSSTEDEKRKELKKLIKKPLLKVETKALSYPARLRYYNILGNAFYLLQDLEKSYLYYNKIIQLVDQHPSYRQNKTGFYMGMLSNLIAIMIMLKKDGALISTFDKVKQFMSSLPKKQHSDNILKTYSDITCNYIHYLLSSLNVSEALKLSEEFTASIKKYYNPEFFLVFHFNLFLIHFYRDDYRMALRQINEILNVEKSGIRPDIIHSAKILNLLVHYELGNEGMLPGLCKSIAYHFEKTKQLHHAEKVIMNFFGKIILRANTRQKKTNAFQELKKESGGIITRQTYNDFDFISWIDSNIENRPFADIMKEKRAGQLDFSSRKRAKRI